MPTQNVIKTASPDRAPTKRKGRVRRFVVCTNDVDRDLDIVEPGGLDWTNHEANPVALFSHAFNSPPVGKVVAHGLNADESECWADIEFATTDDGNQLLALVDQGILRAASLGFRPRLVSPPDWRMTQNLPPNTKAPLRWIRTAEVLEVSLVNIPSNARALIKAYSDGLITVKSICDHIFSSEAVVAKTYNGTSRGAARVAKAVQDLIPPEVKLANEVTTKLQRAVASRAFADAIANQIANEVEKIVQNSLAAKLKGTIETMVDRAKAEQHEHSAAGRLGGSLEANARRLGKASATKAFGPANTMEGQRSRLGLE
jgi:HK97 family phage prohead protease